ncbi:MAG: EamA family transporter [Planctomycetota bacterium]
MTALDRKCTLGGIAAVLLWSSSIAFVRSLRESLGVFSAGAFSYLLAGALGVAYSFLIRDSSTPVGAPASRRPPSGLSVAYLASCGALFVIYQLCLILAIGLAAGGQQVVEAGLINYLWPVLTLVFSIPILKTHARWWVVPGFALALGGTMLTEAQALCSTPSSPGAGGASLAVPLLALVAAITWALYSVLARKHAAARQGNAVPWFFVASGLLMLVLRFVRHEESQWSAGSALSLVYMALFPSLIAYTLWDKAMRQGDMVLVTVFSYFTPLLSTVLTCLLLGVRPGWSVWLACLLLIAGALLSRWSLKEAPAPANQKP